MTTQKWGWSDRLLTQYQPMDDTHREFVSLCSALSELVTPQDYVMRLDALIAHSVAHFEQENQWMVDHQFPPVGCHVNEHDTILEIMREVRRRVEGGELDLADRLAEELPLWFEHHVDTMDNMLAKFMANQHVDGAAPAAVIESVVPIN